MIYKKQYWLTHRIWMEVMKRLRLKKMWRDLSWPARSLSYMPHVREIPNCVQYNTRPNAKLSQKGSWLVCRSVPYMDSAVSRFVCKADSSSGNIPDKQTRDTEDLFDAEYFPRLSGGMSARAHPCRAPRWRDKHDVVLSTKHTWEMTTVFVRTRGGCVLKKKPMAVDDYNRHRAGVDKSDQMVEKSVFPFAKSTFGQRPCLCYAE